MLRGRVRRRRRLLDECDEHTLLRLPTGIFYPAQARPRALAGLHRLLPAPKPRDERTETERFTVFGYEELAARDKANLDCVGLVSERVV